MTDTQQRGAPPARPSRALAASTGVLSGAATAWWLRHRASPAVRQWHPPTIPISNFGALHARVAGDGDHAFVLLHGLVSTGDVFGAAYDHLADSGRLVVPDLLGFGRSLDESRTSFSIESHLDALDELADRADLFQRRWTIGAHSMGSALAMRWAARHADRVDKIVCWGPPIYPSPQVARSQITGSSMARLLVLDSRAAELVCQVSCRHRRGFGRLAMLLEPSLPGELARSVSLHTWPAYRDALHHFVIDIDWAGALNDLDRSTIPMHLIWGTRDPVGDTDVARRLTATSAHVNVAMVADADHYLPMSHPDTCLRHLTTDPAQNPDKPRRQGVMR